MKNKFSKLVELANIFDICGYPKQANAIDVYIKKQAHSFEGQTYSDNDGEWRVSDLYRYALKNSIIKDLSVEDLAGTAYGPDGNEADEPVGSEAFAERANKSDISYPIIVISYPEGLVVADGLHRLYKAWKLKNKTIQAFVINYSDIVKNIKQASVVFRKIAKNTTIEDIKKYVGQPDVFIQFSNILKLGIYPSSKYDTPIGIYGYPLNNEIYEQLKSNMLPFGQDRKYIIVFKITPSPKNLDSITKQELDQFLDKYEDKLDKALVEDMLSLQPGRALWYLSNVLTGRNPKKWTTFLRDELGWSGATDKSGIIHENEPEQGLAFSAGATQLLEVLLNPFEENIVSKSLDKIKKTKKYNKRAVEHILNKFNLMEEFKLSHPFLVFRNLCKIFGNNYSILNYYIDYVIENKIDISDMGSQDVRYFFDTFAGSHHFDLLGKALSWFFKIKQYSGADAFVIKLALLYIDNLSTFPSNKEIYAALQELGTITTDMLIGALRIYVINKNTDKNMLNDLKDEMTLNYDGLNHIIKKYEEKYGSLPQYMIEAFKIKY